MAVAGPLPGAEPQVHLALLAAAPEPPSLEALAVGVAVEAFNRSPAPVQARVRAYASGGSVPGALAAAQALIADEPLGVLVLGEEGADPAVLAALDQAGLAVVLASSWRSPRPAQGAAVWLVPGQERLAALSAEQARKGQRAAQAAVVDNGAPTSVAAARAFADRFRGLGGALSYQGTWEGSDWGLTRTVKELRGHWPQVLFFCGEAGQAGQLVKEMRRHRELKATHLMGLPGLMRPAYFKEAGLAARLSWCLFPAPEFRGRDAFARITGLGLSRASSEYKAYVSYAYRRPGSWAAMAFDGAKLLLDAIASAGADGGTPGRAQVKAALGSVQAYTGIQGRVALGPERSPAKDRAMAFYALPKVNSRAMRWYGKDFGPPFH